MNAQATDSLRDALARLRAANVQLKAFAAVRDDDSALALAGTLRGPLAGQLVAVKDIFDTTDFPTAYGSAIYSGHQPSTEAAMVGIIRHAGGLVVGKATTTEFAFLQPSPTLNPAAPGCTPGGSSSGSAAAVAAGLVPLAIGSQTGGSIVRPASYCGVVGFKPSFGLLPTAGMKCFSWSLDTVGLFARSVDEVAAFAQAVSGGRVMAPTPRPAEGWTFGLPRAYPWGEPSASGAMAMARAREALQAVGARVVEVDLPDWAGESYLAHDAVQGWEAARALTREVETSLPRLSDILRDYLQEAGKVSDEAYASAQAVARRARAGCRDWLPGVDVLLTPSAPDEAPEGFATTGASTWNRAWTLLGAPTLNVPGATGVNGRPMGLQVIAPPGSDSRCLAAGALLERGLLAP
ncbi:MULTISPECIES: amidase [Ramlibacter]|uniref:Amidase n=1 Tax=Ramlibacter aquaticus TaxID=2780094 RepID=A0ABR9SGH8_9BURK|nr:MULTISPECIES: amidase [Ramlibacter]MBE7941460.1 amidase [Ramlibacter aquaticus]